MRSPKRSIASPGSDRARSPVPAADAPDLAGIFFAAVHEVASAYYSPAQVEAWAPQVPEAQRFIDRAEDGRTVLVSVDDDDRPIAYADVEADGHIDHFYCRPEFTRTGIATALYAALEEAAGKRGVTQLHVEASEPARRFFSKQGFATADRNAFALNSVAIHNYDQAAASRR